MVEPFEDLNDIPLFSIDGTKIILVWLLGIATFAVIFGLIITGW